jgi:hypothetical protein
MKAFMQQLNRKQDRPTGVRVGCTGAGVCYTVILKNTSILYIHIYTYIYIHMYIYMYIIGCNKGVIRV